MDAAVVPMEPNFLTEDEVREAELDACGSRSPLGS